jgi:hypothetical protein
VLSSIQGTSHIEEVAERDLSIPHYVDIVSAEEEEKFPQTGLTTAMTPIQPVLTTSEPKAESVEPVTVCGIPPNYTPCVPLEEANYRMQTCCQQRNLPPGCQKLCTYQVTQAEVRPIFQCKIQINMIGDAIICYIFVIKLYYTLGEICL